MSFVLTAILLGMVLFIQELCRPVPELMPGTTVRTGWFSKIKVPIKIHVCGWCGGRSSTLRCTGCGGS